MRAVVGRQGRLIVEDVPQPEPLAGQALVRTTACGICGSDLHFMQHGEEVADAARRSNMTFADPKRDVVLGHEFCAEVVDYGPDSSRNYPEGTLVCSVPALLCPDFHIEPLGYSNEYPGGYGEYMCLTEMLMLPVPNGLDAERAALTEPMAVGMHAVAKARLEPHDACLVIGCGPVGLAVIAALKLRNVHPIIAADFSKKRREFAVEMGADIVVDPGESSPYDSFRTAAVASDPSQAVPTLLGTPGTLRPQVIFECVGVPGIIQQICEGAERNAKIVVVGVCMQHDTFEPVFAINKQLNLQFVFGYEIEEFADTLRHIAEGDISVDRLITGKIGCGGVAQAFKDLASPEEHAKILIEPWRE